MSDEQETLVARTDRFSVAVEGRDYRAPVGMDPGEAHAFSRVWASIADFLTREKASTPMSDVEVLHQLAVVLLSNPLAGDVPARLCQAYPWMHELSADDLLTCVRELSEAARTAFVENQPHLAVQELRAWESTAAAVADGLGPSRDER